MVGNYLNENIMPISRMAKCREGCNFLAVLSRSTLDFLQDAQREKMRFTGQIVEINNFYNTVRVAI